SLGIDSNALPVVNLALEQLERKRVQYFALDDAFQWSGAVCRVIAEFDEEVLRGNGQFQLYVPLSKATQQALDLDLPDLTQFIARQHMEMMVSSIRFRNSGLNVCRSDSSSNW